MIKDLPKGNVGGLGRKSKISCISKSLFLPNLYQITVQFTGTRAKQPEVTVG